MRKKMTHSILVTAVVAALATPAFAAEGFYAGVSAGQSDFRDVCDDLSGIGFVGSCDDTDTGWKLFGGYQFTPNWGVEVGYSDIVKTSASGTVLGVPITSDVEANGIAISAIGTWPVGDNFGVFGKVGIYRWDVESRTTVGGVSATVDDNGTDLMFGIGARYALNEQFAIRAEWERFNDGGDKNTTGESDTDFLSAGVVFSF